MTTEKDIMPSSHQRIMLSKLQVAKIKRRRIKMTIKSPVIAVIRKAILLKILLNQKTHYNLSKFDIGNYK